eukprot:TRINITY_DN68136_c0_g1_i1.p1 TRINITY_DN68136_c0_g1~~TRINITY_DN68136_c0_g1_i1.p1  ORF type:complete len:965 (-),score=134.27 TRINITY_DN68136_c0_g1_i1:722-3616(-)
MHRERSRSGTFLGSQSFIPPHYSQKPVKNSTNFGRMQECLVRSTVSSSSFEKQDQVCSKVTRPSRLAIHSRAIVESRTCTFVTSVLTVYALIGDDMRLMFFEMPADIWFFVMTALTMLIFGAEVCLSCIGKEDYFLSFFCLLDVVSTSTLILDLTNALIVDGEEDLDNLRGSRTARIGARAGRVVRVLRLVRILKLYKAVYDMRNEQQAEKKDAVPNRSKPASVKPGTEDDWDNMDVEEKGVFEQSQVGKKLSALTIRRVICLVLLMMLILPLMRVDNVLPTSSDYGADLVYQAFKRMMNSTMIQDVSDVAFLGEPAEMSRHKYERSLLTYIYHHNWYTAKKSCPYASGICSNLYFQHVFWVGIASKSKEKLVPYGDMMRIRPSAMEKWEANIDTKENMYTYGSMPRSVQSIITSDWTFSCTTPTGLHRFGFSLLPKLDGKDPPYVSNNYPVECPEDLRRTEWSVHTPTLVSDEKFHDWRFVFYFDLRPLVKTEAIFAFFLTVFVCLSLTSAALFFVNDANSLVLSPVESMINRVAIIRSNPLRAIKMADEDFKAEEAGKHKQRASRFQAWTDMLCCVSKRRQEPLETVLLEKTIIKLGSLLALGFGEAGASIIGANLSGADSACVNAMVLGQMVECIIGCIRINDFGIATEVLQGKIMTFVNQIAEIVHGVADEFHGAVNKNYGDGFLTIWRTWELEDQKVVKLADMSMVAVSRILAAINKSPVLAGYRSHPGLQQRLGKHLRVRLACGLHFGWAIEGAVGSEFKIDASYLSPNVSLADTLERLTRLYGVSILVSEAVISICTSELASKCRLIDHVKLGSIAMELYVIDLDYESITVDDEPKKIPWSLRQRFKVRQFLEAEKNEKWDDNVSMATYFANHRDITTMRGLFSVDFLHIFNMGFQNYAQGEWQVAARTLHRTSTMLGKKDGPSLALLRYMDQWQYEVPEGWFGIREITKDELPPSG